VDLLILQRFPNFDILRLSLAVYVVIAHSFLYTTPSLKIYPLILPVPAFLAISGVVVLKAYSEVNSLKEFAKRRVLRIFPALAASIILIFLLFDLQVALNSIVTYLTAGMVLPTAGYTNYALWSLAWEQLAYLILILLGAIGAYKRGSIPILIWFILFGCCLCVIYFPRFHLDSNTIMIAMLAQAFFWGT